jgi:hypothetical protein
MTKNAEIFDPYERYPEPQARRSGCKVGWYYYSDKADADKCAVVARRDAERQLDIGYDFGYCWPGTVRQVPEDHEQHAGLYEVCIP